MEIKFVTTTCPYCGSGCSFNLVVKDGKIIEQGNHKELLAKKGYYHDLYYKQFEEEEAQRVLAEG